MTDKISPELSASNLAALDLLIAHMEETGQVSLGGADFITAIVTAVKDVAVQAVKDIAVEAVKDIGAKVVEVTGNATQEIIANTDVVTPVVEAAAGMGAIPHQEKAEPLLRAGLDGEITLERLVTVRRILNRL
jgi:hypothetical protein